MREHYFRSVFHSVVQIFNRFTASPIRARLAYGAYWGTVATIVPKIGVVAASFLLARILGQTVFGEYGVIFSTIIMVSSFSGLGLGSTVVKHLAEFKNSAPERAGRILALSTMVNWGSALAYSIFFVIFAPWLSSSTLAAPHLAPMLQLSAISLAMATITALQQNVLVGLESFRTSALVTTITSLLQSAMLVVGAWLGQLTGAVIALAISSVITALIFYKAIEADRRKFNITLNWREAKKEWKVFVEFSLPAFLGGILVGPVFWGGNAILAHQPNGYAELGIVNAANQWQQILQFIPGVLGAALLPIMSEKIGAGDRLGSYTIMKKMTGMFSLVIIPITVILTLLSPLIMRGYGHSFEAGSVTLVLFLLAGALLAIMTPVGLFVAASGRMWTGFLMNLGWALSMLAGCYLLASWGAEGIGWARLIAYLLHSTWTVGFVLYLKRKLVSLPA